MQIRFNEAKATQAAAEFLRLRGGTMSYIKLIKLLYLLDRESLLRWGRPVTTDKYVSMDKGPVLSAVYDLITDEPTPGSHSIWREYITEPSNHEVSLIKASETDELSAAEKELIGEVFQKYGKMGRWEIVDFSHTLREWVNPQGSAFPIEYRDILRVEGKTATEIAEIEEELEHLALFEVLLQPQ